MVAGCVIKDFVSPKLFEIFDAKPVWLEIGFGGGEHLIHQAILNPDIGFIGCEPYQNGVAEVMG